MAKQLAKTYEPNDYEAKIYQRWETSGFFNPDNLSLPKNARPFTVILPPPNITDRLHLGHAAMLAIEDVFVRYKRLQGYRTLWLPGTDHAAIATQTVVEKKLKADTGQTRQQIGREEFLKLVWKFLRATQAVILQQIKTMGASLDWSRLAFTLDEPRRQAVKEMFVQMYEAGLIYRGERVVNWCVHCQSTLADDEVEYKEQSAKLYTFRYDKKFPIFISTTRPETKLGDTAVAVNPRDARYKKFIGQTLAADFCGRKLKLKIIADRNVDQDFGSGALGVTAAHSLADWQLAEDNDLPLVKVINEQGLINDGFGHYSGLSTAAARKKIVSHLKENNLLKKEEELANNLSVCYRCGSAIEPLPSRQWFVAVNKPVKRLGNKSLKEAALAASGKIYFLPERFAKRYLDWMNNLRDWCISRQIWFGHELPVWYKKNSKFTEEEIYVGREKPTDNGWQQDTDTLDTWFSSGMWTFSTLGWPDNFKNNKKSGDLAKFHPPQLMETGYEIITLWVSRMIMMSLFAMGEIPFEKVYLHGMVLDKQGKKMSKSKGNGIDPLTMAKAYGADAVRLSLLIGNTPGTDWRVSEEKIAAYRNFVNKFWNIARFIVAQIDEAQINLNKPQVKTLADNWILSELDRLIVKVTSGLEKYDFALAGKLLEDFTWNELADWYLEIAKIEKNKAEILNYILNVLLKLWHPLMPFVSETIWQELYGEKEFLMVEQWPQGKNFSKQGADIEIIKGLVVGIRNARSASKLAPAQKIKAVIYAARDKELKLLQANAELIKNLKTGVNDLIIKQAGDKIAGAIYFGCDDLEVYLLAAADPGKERVRLEREFVKLEKYLTVLEAKLVNREFINKAPAALVNETKAKLAQAKDELKKIEAHLEEL